MSNIFINFIILKYQAMKFHIKAGQQPKRQRICIGSLNQLLNPNKITRLPQQYIKRNIFSTTSTQSFQPHQTAISKSLSNKKLIINLKLNSKNTSFSETQKSNSDGLKFHKFNNNKLVELAEQGNQLQNKNNHNYFANQLKNSATMTHFRFRSLDLDQRKQIKTAKNTMWRPIHHTLRLAQSKQKQKLKQKTDNQKKLLPKKSQYLKKCSNINKKVIANLLRLKLGQKFNQYPFPQQQAESNLIRNNQILQMIKIYKGYDQSQTSLYQSRPNITRKSIQQPQYYSQKQNNLKRQLQIKTFPFRNINIELSVARWQNLQPQMEQQNQQM